MKRLSLLILIIGLIFFCSQNTTAQEKKKNKEAKVKVLMNKDGKSIKFDTIIQDFKNHKDIIKILKSKNLSDSLFEVFEGDDFMWISDDKKSHGKHKIIVKEFHDSDSSLHSKIKKHIQVISDGDEKIIISDGENKDKTIKIEILDEDGNIHMKHSKGKKVYIIKEDIDLDISEDGDMKTITVKCKSDHDEEVSVEVEITEDGKSIKKIKRKKKKAKKNKKEKK